jgi:hypothetical protein
MALWKYIKSAFLNRWNLLLFLGGMGFAALSQPEVVAPLVLAAEVTYLGLLGTHPRFQKYVDAQDAKAAREGGTSRAEENVERIVGALPQGFLQRYEALRSRCIELRQLARDIKDPGRPASDMPLEEIQLAGLDRLLWIFLRLLFTRHSLDRFLEKTSPEAVKAETRRIEEQLARLASAPDELRTQRMRKALEDNLETCKARLANLEKARDNHELLALEIDRLENKIRSLSELAINRQEPDFISGQVDQVTASMLTTEKTMNELQFATGIDMADEAVPELVRRPVVRAKE